MKRFRLLAALSVALFCVEPAAAQTDDAEKETGCVACHKNIEPIRDPKSEMMQEIFAIGKARGDEHGCVVCHGGNVRAEEKEEAHGGRVFYPDPGSSWINKQTCGRCHPDHTDAQWQSLMMTEAGKIQGTSWAFGALTGYEHKWANYDVENPADKTARIGTDRYRSYMEHLTQLQPQVFVSSQKQLPAAPTDLASLADNPSQAAFTYMRNQCQRCHHGVKGRQVRGDFRGMGCSSCHIPYGNDGLYQGADPTIPKDQPGHPLVHSIQATRESKVTVGKVTYSGIPAETCAACHNRGKRIGVSYQGLMESAYQSPFGKDGQPQPALHTKHYIAMHQDIHYQKGMLCQDCHTSIDVHGDGFIAAANLASVEIECSDCHGTPKSFPWELPLGYMDEFSEVAATGPSRGTTDKLTARVTQGTVYPPRDGYLLSARGNAISNAVRDGDKVIVYASGGAKFELEPLKLEELSLEGMVAMKSVRGHMNRMECYTCHSAWAPQCYGCHVKIDYSGEKTSFDWLAAGHQHMRPEHKADRGESGYDTTMPGQIEEQRSFMRWDNPPMGVNGEGRITPVSPGCQLSATVIGKDGKAILLNHIFRTPPDTEGGGPEGQLAIDMSPVHPHTMTEHARSCQSCHLSRKALGYGIDGGTLTRPMDQRVVVDLQTADGRIIPRDALTQISPIAGLDDWTRFVSEEGRQLQTVGHHFTGSRPLDDAERAHVDRDGLCLACHQEIPDRSLPVSVLHHVAEYSNQLPKTPEQHTSLIHKTLLFAAWGQVGMMLGGPLVFAGGVFWFWRRRKARREAS